MSRLEKLAELLCADPEDVFLHYALATEQVKQGHVVEGLAGFTAIHESFPDYVPAWFKHAQVLAEDDQTEAARSIGQRGLETARRVGDLHAAGELEAFLEML